MPADLKSGDRVRISDATAGEDGVVRIDALERIED